MYLGWPSLDLLGNSELYHNGPLPRSCQCPPAHHALRGFRRARGVPLFFLSIWQAVLVVMCGLSLGVRGTLCPWEWRPSAYRVLLLFLLFTGRQHIFGVVLFFENGSVLFCSLRF